MSTISQKLISASGPKEATDPDFPSVTALYHFDGSNGSQNNTFTGVGPSGASQSWTRNGSPTQGSFSPFSAEEGKWSIEFDGSVYCSSATSDDFEFGTGDYTIEAWVWKNTTGQQHIYDGRWPDNAERVLFYVNSSDKLAANIDGSDKGASTSDFPLNQWVHIALTRSGTTGYLFQNGTQVATWTGDSVDIEKPPYSIFIGRDSYGDNYYWNGFMSNIRVLKGTAAYTGSSYSVPTSPLTAITNTKLLTARMNRFIDSSASAHVMTNNGIGVTPFSPFAPSEAYDASTMGGSGTFDITNTDYLAATSSNHAIGTSDFTIEGWFYVTDDANQYGTGFFQGDAAGQKGPAVGQWLNGYQIFHGTSATNLSNTKYRRNEWVHVALVRASNVLNLYQNGVKVTSDISDSTNYTATVFNIGWYYSTSYSMEGHISNFKMCLNASYTSNFIPPTALVTSTSGGSSAASTKILVDFTNAAIFDQTGKTNVQTVNNAQLDTSIKKFGSASVEFDGTNDYLSIPTDSVNLNFGSSDFTLETWAYIKSATSNGGICGLYTTTGNQRSYIIYQTDSTHHFGVAMSSDGTYQSGSVIDSGVDISAYLNQWIHLAFTKSGTNGTLYLNGTSIGTTSSAPSTLYASTSSFYVGTMYGASADLDGFVDELRITRGKVRYTSNFTAPSKAFPNL